MLRNVSGHMAKRAADQDREVPNAGRRGWEFQEQEEGERAAETHREERSRGRARRRRDGLAGGPEEEAFRRSERPAEGLGSEDDGVRKAEAASAKAGRKGRASCSGKGSAVHLSGGGRVLRQGEG